MAEKDETKLGPLVRHYDSIGKAIDMLNQGGLELRISGVGLDPLKSEVCLYVTQNTAFSDKLEELLLTEQKKQRQEIKDLLDTDH